jgi:hypothetical protein
MLKIGFDIGGVLSKYPDTFEQLISSLSACSIFCITDQHPKEEVIKTLRENKFDRWFGVNNVFCANYEQHGNMCKSILIKELGLDIFIDDFDGYLQWDSSLGRQPILLKVMPDAFLPYWANNWFCEGGEFGRRKFDSKEDISEQLRVLSESLMDCEWNHPITAVEDCLSAGIELKLLREENVKLKKELEKFRKG